MKKPPTKVQKTARTPAAKPTMASLLAELNQVDGITPSPLSGVLYMRSTKKWPRARVTYQPSIVIIAQGRKRGHLGGHTFRYDADNYLVLSVPLPFECDTVGSPEEPLLGISVSVTPALVAELLMEMHDLPPVPDAITLGVSSHRLDEGLRETAIRLLLSLRTSEETRILGPQLVRELIYRVLCREQGGTLRALAAPHSHFGQISRALQRMHTHFAQPVDITTLAGEAGMSVSTFHSHFKAVTSSPPLQYLKSIRLQKARLLMVRDSLTAAEACREVGYESASQFSREFKRYFGNTPAAVASELRSSVAALG